MGLGRFLRDWNDFAAETDCGTDSEYFCEFEVGLRIFLSEEKKGENFNSAKICLKKQNEKMIWT